MRDFKIHPITEAERIKVLNDVCAVVRGNPSQFLANTTDIHDFDNLVHGALGQILQSLQARTPVPEASAKIIAEWRELIDAAITLGNDSIIMKINAMKQLVDLHDLVTKSAWRPEPAGVEYMVAGNAGGATPSGLQTWLTGHAANGWKLRAVHGSNYIFERKIK